MNDFLTPMLSFMSSLSPSSCSVVCFSHLRWNYVLQRPQHLMERFARSTNVYYVEEAVRGGDENKLEVSVVGPNLTRIVPSLREGLSDDAEITVEKELLARFFIERDITQYIFWYYTPLALTVSDHFNPALIIYDCMVDLATFRFSPQSVREREMELLRKADLVFTGGQSLYEARKNRHPEVHVIPGSVDVEHFRQGRLHAEDPRDQVRIPGPRIGFYGVIDERMDYVLLEQVARRKPEWHFVMVGPVAPGSQYALPRLPNIHWLGSKNYDELPAYLAGWDLTIVPYAHNEATRYLNPTKIPEYLAAGKPVIATPITDVLRLYGRNGLVSVAGTPEEFIRVAGAELEVSDHSEWLDQVDEWLSHQSWDKTFQRMMYHLTRRLKEKERTMHDVSPLVAGH